MVSLHENGISLANSDSEFVVLGEGRNLTLEMVQRAVDIILAGEKLLQPTGIPLGKRSRDRIIWELETNSNDRGSNRPEAFVTGKPSPVMMRSARKYFGLETGGTTVIGDTMETDIQGGVQMGYKTILVSLWHGPKGRSQPFCLQTQFDEEFIQ